MSKNKTVVLCWSHIPSSKTVDRSSFQQKSECLKVSRFHCQRCDEWGHQLHGISEFLRNTRAIDLDVYSETRIPW